jgi:Flp pilus assembly pilin Flp
MKDGPFGLPQQREPQMSRMQFPLRSEKRRMTGLKKNVPFLGEKGMSSIEYALISVLIATVIVLAVTTLGQGVVNLFSSVSNSFPK